VSVHDFMDKELGKAIPYGVYDLTENRVLPVSLQNLWQDRGRNEMGRLRRRRRDGPAVGE